jgi:hypothetical protein
MGETQVFFLRLGIGFASAVILGIVCFLAAGRRGRDTVGWFFNGFFPGLVGFEVLAFACPSHVGWMAAGFLSGVMGLVSLLMLRPLETPGQTRGCAACGRVVRWKVAACPRCGATLGIPASPQEKVRRPLRRFYFYLFLLIALLLIVFGLIGYYCVPDQPQISCFPAGKLVS